MVVRFSLPERLSGSAQQEIGLTSCEAFQRLEQAARLHQRKQQDMDMIGHDHKRTELVMPEFDSTLDGIHHQSYNCVLAEEQWAPASGIQVAIDPNEGLTG